MGSMIDAMIAKVRQGAQTAAQQRMAKLNARRDRALRRIGQGALDHGLELSQSAEADAQLAARLESAQRARISEAEAMADLAEFDGDIVSPLWWWDIQAGNANTIWKGYVRDRRLCELRFVASSDGLREGSEEPGGQQVHLDIVARQACTGEFVASVSCEGSVAVGISEGEGASVQAAVARAYVAFWVWRNKLALHESYVPRALMDSLNVDSEAEKAVGSDGASSQDADSGTPREREERTE